MLNYFIRRITYVGIGLGIKDFNLGGLQIVLLLSLCQLSQIHTIYSRSQRSIFFNRIEIFNEFMTMAGTLHMVLFTDWIKDKSLQFYLTWTMISLIGLTLIVNLYFIFMKILQIVFVIFKMIYVNKSDLLDKFKSLL